MQFSHTSRIGKGFEFEVASNLLRNLDRKYDLFFPISDDNGCDLLICNNQNEKHLRIQIKAKQNQEAETIRFGNIDKQAAKNTAFLFYFNDKWAFIPINEFNFGNDSISTQISISEKRFEEKKVDLKTLHNKIIDMLK
ncbi:hypothetical protein [Candidatus Deianiraea vastatrix]|nr:hypothetical protein [Candidatus Deianiraea vastatrix]